MEERVTKRRPASGQHEGAAALLRRPWVLGVLALAAVLPSLQAVNAEPGEEPAITLEAQRALPLLPEWAIDGKDYSVEEMWRLHAVARESKRLAETYLAQGYRVTPQITEAIAAAAHEHEIDLDVAFGLVRAESGFRNAATSPVGATGLTQLMPRTAAWMRPGVTTRDLRDPRVNLDIGFQYLRYLLDKYDGDTRLALLAYNRGPGTVDRALRRGANPDNGYADFVMGKRDHGHRLFTNPARGQRATARRR